jgi:hypothetical protein
MKTAWPEASPPLEAAVRLLPACHFEERHRQAGIVGPPKRIIAVIRGFDERQDAVLAKLLWARELPGRWLARVWPGRGIPAHRRRFGLADFSVLEEGDSDITFGLVGKFWELDFCLTPITGPESFARLSGPGLAKLVLSFRVMPQEGGLWQLETVTRVYCTDATARRWMTPYWVMVRPFSGWIRRRILRQIKLATERTLQSHGTT